MRVLEAGGGLDLGEEALAADDGTQFGVEDLDGDLAGVLQVLGEVDGSHAALAQLALEVVAVAEGRGEAGKSVCHLFLSCFRLEFGEPVLHVHQLLIRAIVVLPDHQEATVIGCDVVLRAIPGPAVARQ